MNLEKYLIAGTFLLFVGSCYMFNTTSDTQPYIEATEPLDKPPVQDNKTDAQPVTEPKTEPTVEPETVPAAEPDIEQIAAEPVPQVHEENKTITANQSEHFTVDEFRSLCGNPPSGASLVEEGSGVLWFEYYQFPGGTKAGPYIKWSDKAKTQARMFRCYNRDGDNNGPAVDWDQNGNKQAEYYYVNGTYDGPYREWSGGILVKELNYAMGKRDGEQKEYSASGMPLATESYVLGIKDGVWSTYYPNGQLKEKTSYSDDIKNANYWLYYDDGTLQSKRVGGLDGVKFTGVLYNYNRAENGVQEGTECEFVNGVNVGCRDITQNI